MTEPDFHRLVVELAELCGWLTFHDYDSRRSNPGFPDLVLVRPPRLIFAELKSQGGRVRKHQEIWLAALGECEVETYLWRPADWPEIQEALRRVRISAKTKAVSRG